jgi:hypothetical protein
MSICLITANQAESVIEKKRVRSKRLQEAVPLGNLQEKNSSGIMHTLDEFLACVAGQQTTQNVQREREAIGGQRSFTDCASSLEVRAS